MKSWIDKHELCLRYCGLTESDSVCFNHQIRQCRGICAGQEEIESYNERANTILREQSFVSDNFIIVDKGRSISEHAVILVENARYAGYGYYDTVEQISEPSELKSYVKRNQYYPDCDVLVKQFIRDGKRRIISLEAC